MPRPELSTLRYPHLWQGCVGAWCPSQSGATGYRLFDDSGNNNHGVLTGMDPGTDWVPSGGKLALDFDGSNDHVTMGNTTAFTIGTPFSLVAWVRHTMAAASNILSKQQNTSPFTGLGFGTSSDGRFEFFLFSGSGIIVHAPAGHNDGKWRHVVCTYNGGSSVASQQIFVDGVSQTLTTVQNITPSSVTTASAVQISGRDGGNNPFLGQVDDVRIYNRALTPSEISLLYTGGRGAAYERSRGRKKAYVPGYRITAPSRIQTGSARTIDGTDTESLSRGLVGAWCPSLGASGYRLIDRSGNNNHGALTNMDPGTDWVPSGGKLALDFDGVNDYADILDSPSLNPTKQITVCCWYYSRGLPSSTTPFTYCLLGKVSSVVAEPYPAFDIRGSSTSTLELAIAIGTSFKTVSLGTITQNTWTFIAATYSGTLLAGYRNGVLLQSSSQTGDIGTTTNPLRLGDNSGFTGRLFNGQLDDIRIYNRALTPSEIRLLYTGGRGVGLMPEVKPKRARIVAWDNQDKISVPARVLTNTDSLKRGLVGHWSPSVSGPQGNRLMDLSGQNNHGTLQNMDYQTDYVPSAEKGGRMALDFDGVDDFVNVLDTPQLRVTSAFTLSCWFRRVADGSMVQNYFQTALVSGVVLGFNIDGSSSGRIGGLIGTNTGTVKGTHYQTVAGGTTISDSLYHHAVFRFDLQTITMFLDGKLDGQVAWTQPAGFQATSIVRIGVNEYQSGVRNAFFNGKLDDIRIYNRALTPSEIRLLAQSRMPERATPQRTRTVFYSSGLISYLRRRSYNSILGSGVLS